MRCAICDFTSNYHGIDSYNQLAHTGNKVYYNRKKGIEICFDCDDSINKTTNTLNQSKLTNHEAKPKL